MNFLELLIHRSNHCATFHATATLYSCQISLSPINKSAILKFVSRFLSSSLLYFRIIMGSLYFEIGDKIFDLKFFQSYGPDNGLGH